MRREELKRTSGASQGIEVGADVTTKLVQRLIEEAKKEARKAVERDARLMPEILQPLLAHVREHIFDDDFQIGKLEKLNLMSWRIRNVFREKIGTSIKKYVTGLKGTAAKWLLLNSTLQVREIAIGLGYKDGRVQNFSRDFERWTGKKPDFFRPRRAIRVSRDPREDLEFGELNTRPILMRPGLTGTFAKEISEGLWETLREESPAMQDYCLRKLIGFGHRSLFDRLLAESRKVGRYNRQRGLQIARLPAAFMDGSSILLGSEAGDLRVLSHAWLANAYRLAGDFYAAELSFADANFHYENVSENLRVKAELDWLFGTLRLYQLRHSDALRFFASALDAAKLVEDQTLEINIRLQRAAARFLSGEMTQAIRDQERAVELLIRRSDLDDQGKNNYLGSLQNLIWLNIESNQIEKGRALLERANEVYEGMPENPTVRTQHTWLLGLLAKADRDLGTAIQYLRRARADFIDYQHLHEAALVSLDLGLIYKQEGRHEEVVSLLVADVLPVLESLRSGSEHIASYSMLRSAVSECRISDEALHSSRRLIARSRWVKIPARPASGS